MYKKIDLENWYRRETFMFYESFEDPFFNVTVNVEITSLLLAAQSAKSSFFLESLFAALSVANKIEAFKSRILKDDIICYDTVHGGSTVLNDDKSFSFCYFDFVPHKTQFITMAQSALAKHREKKLWHTKEEALDKIHFTVLPWMSFTSIKHARKVNPKDCIPCIAFGKYFKEGNKVFLPVNVEANHKVMDGFHLGQFFNQFEVICK